MPHKNFPPSRSIHVRAIVYALVILAAVVCLPPALTRLTVLAQEDGGGAPADAGDVQPRAEFVRHLSLPASDVVYNPADRMLYASMPSSAGAAGNAIVPINPATGETGAPVFVGSEPGKLAMSDDGHTLYISLNGATAIRRFDTATRTPGQQFSIGNGSTSSYAVNDLAVAPGNPNLLAVARHYSMLSPPSAGVAVFDNGVQRSKTSPGHTQGADFLAFSATESKLYASGQYSYLQTLTIDASGVAATSYTLFDIRTRIKFANGRLYSATGQIINPETKTLLGTFAGAADPFTHASYNAFVIDAVAGRAYYLTPINGTPTLKAFDLNTFEPVGSASLPDIKGAPTATVRWGANGIAFRTDAGVYLVQTSLIPSSEPIPTPTPSVSPTPTPSASPTPTIFPVVVNKVNLPAKDLVINAATQTLYASVPSSAGGTAANSITSIDPKTGAIGAPVFIGNEPGKLAISDDGQVLYAYLEGAKAIRRFDIATKTPGMQFSVGEETVGDMEVVPGSQQSLAVSRGSGEGISYRGSVGIYDNGVQRPNTTNGIAYNSRSIAFGSTPTTLHSTSDSNLTKFELDASGIQLVSDVRNIFSGFNNRIKFAGGRVYSTSGIVVDPETNAQVGRFNREVSENRYTTLLVDQSLGRVFFLSGGPFSDSSAVLTAYDINTFLPLGSVRMPNVPGTPVGLVRWGTDGLAFCMLSNSSDPSAQPNRIYLIQSALVSDGKPVPSMLQFSAPGYTISESSSLKTSIIVKRTGGVTGAATVNYATVGGTATPGSDYTPTSGTLSFAEGETTKTFTVSINDDNVYEGTSETIGLTLSEPSGDVVLGAQKTATLTIQDSKSRPSLIPVSLAVPEGESGVTNAQFVVQLSHPSAETISANYATANLTATANSDYVPASGTITFQPGEMEKTIPLQINGDTVEEPNERFLITFSNLVNATLTVGTNFVTIVNDDGSFIQFAAPTFTAGEGDGRATITVTRFGPTGAQATANYRTVDDPRAIRCDDNSAGGGAAFARCDYATTFDTLLFAPGETSKTFTIPLVDDGHVEPGEFVNLQLISALGATIGAQSSAVLSITDNDAPNRANPVDEHDFFVRQHYLDFLSREPDAEGLAAWTGVLGRCPNAFNTDADSPSVLCDRNVVSSSFFRSTEFELKGYFVYRFYRVAFERRPDYGEFISDMRRVTGQTAEEVYSRRRSFSDSLVLRQEFATLYGAKTNAQLVDLLLGRYGLTVIHTPDPANPDGDALVRLTLDELVAALDAGRLTKSQVVRAVVESREVDAMEYNGAFVAMQYYGYLRRAPEQSGYDAWLEVITRGEGYRVMVNGFMNSTEYRLRFGK
ncbi:MAG TPA: Calx-beta domain-containing protein [Pyrinomonadaceae bacterium]|nr:Calx-beta domain-containing protein [Pyrinomonadaceae bacterium]